MNDLNEYAFALGALAHYAADNSGHRLPTNRSVAILYPGLGHKYGHAVTYEDKPSAHLKVEHGFDADQVAKGHYAPKAHHDFIGFAVSKPVLERAFTKTYSLDLSSVFFSVGFGHWQLPPRDLHIYSTNDWKRRFGSTLTQCQTRNDRPYQTSQPYCSLLFPSRKQNIRCGRS